MASLTAGATLPEELSAFLARVLPGKRLTLNAIERRWRKAEHQRVHAMVGGPPPRTERIRTKILAVLEKLARRGLVQHSKVALFATEL